MHRVTNFTLCISYYGFTDSKKVELKMKELVKTKVIRFITCVATSIFAFSLAYFPLSYNLSPLGIAFVAAQGHALSPFALIGAAAGYFTSPHGELLNIRYITSLVALAVLKGALRGDKDNISPLFCGICAAFVCLLTGLTVILSTHVTLFAVLMCLLEATLCGGSTFFLRKVIAPNDRYDQELKVSVGAYQIAGNEGDEIGDAYTSFYTDDGLFVIVLSDGMGTGRPAFLISNLSVKILRALLKDGVSFKAAIGLLSAAIMVNAQNETLTTADVLCVDCNTGKVDIYKAGAASTLIKRNGHVEDFSEASLPVGILKNTEYSHIETSVGPEDVILMSSDGIWIEDADKIKKCFLKSPDSSMHALAKRIAKTALNPEGETDDITVIAAKVESC